MRIEQRASARPSTLGKHSSLSSGGVLESERTLMAFIRLCFLVFFFQFVSSK